MAELRRLSSPTSPWCFRCGFKGHLALSCRNAVVCFVCNRLGHRSAQCHSLRSEIAKPPPFASLQPPIPNHQPPLIHNPPIIHQKPPQIATQPSNPELPNPLPSSLPSTASFTPATQAEDPMPSHTSLRPAIRTFHATSTSENLEAVFKMSFLLNDIEHWGLNESQQPCTR